MPDTDGTVMTALSLHLSRDQILDATEKCLRESGYDATTIRRIAGELDCAVGSIYRYFKDKRELLYAVTQRLLGPAAMLADKGGVAESEREYLACAARSPLMYRLMFWLACVEGESGRPSAAMIPDIVSRILDAWTRKLGDSAEARRRWIALHGQVVLGESVPPSITMPIPKPMPVMRPVTDRQAVIAELPPLPVQPAPDHVPPTLTAEMTPILRVVAMPGGAELSGATEDVCLL